MKISKRAIAVLLLAAASSAAALYYLRRGPNAAPSAAARELISLVPPDAAYLFYADLAALRSSPFVARLAALAPDTPEERDYLEFVRATGFDYRRDLDRIVLAMQPATSPNFTVALAEGRFDRGKIISYALRTGKLDHQSGVDVYVVPSRATGKSFTLAFMNANRIALADGPSIAPLLAPHAPGLSIPGMRERIARLAGAAFFAVGRVGPMAEGISLGGMRSEQLANLVRSLRWFSVAARPEGERMRVAAEGECDTRESARQLAGTLDGLRLLGQAALADSRARQRIPPETAAVLENLLRAAEVSREAERVRVLLELTPEMLGSATGKTGASRPAAHQ